MQKRLLNKWALSVVTILLFSCKKTDSGDTPNVPCTGKTISLSPSIGQNADPCSKNGKITVTASGSTNFSYKIDNGTFQSTNDFSNLAPGTHSIIVKDGAGCEKTTNIDLPALTAGAKFQAVKAVITANCAFGGCHGGTTVPDLRVDCNIVAVADRIKIRAVDNAGIAGQMPPPSQSPLVQADRDRINAWITAGKRFTD